MTNDPKVTGPCVGNSIRCAVQVMEDHPNYRTKIVTMRTPVGMHAQAMVEKREGQWEWLQLQRTLFSYGKAVVGKMEFPGSPILNVQNVRDFVISHSNQFPRDRYTEVDRSDPVKDQKRFRKLLEEVLGPLEDFLTTVGESEAMQNPELKKIMIWGGDVKKALGLKLRGF